MRTRINKVVRFTLILLASLGWVVALPPLAHAQTSSPVRSIPNLDLIIMVDQSHSQLFTDPFFEVQEGANKSRATNRSQAFDALINTLSVDTLGLNLRVAVILFGTESVLVQDFTDVNAPGAWERLRRNFLSQHTGELQDMGWTDVNRALALAKLTFERGRNPNAKPAMILLTDGKPEIPSANERDSPQAYGPYLEQIYRTYASYGDSAATRYSGPVCNSNPNGPAPLYVVPAIHDVYWRPKFYDVAPYDTFWEKLTTIGRTRPRPVVDDLGSLQRTFVEVLLELICQPAIEIPLFVPSVSTYDVSDIYVQILFKALKDNPDITMEVYRPNPDGSPTDLSDPVQKAVNRVQHDGKVVKNTKTYLDEDWGIGRHQPWSGKWTIVLNGRGTVDFFFIRTSDVFHVNLVKPAAGTEWLPVCKPLDVWVNLLNSAYRPVTDPVTALNIQVRSPNGAVDAPAVALEGVTYRARSNAVTTETDAKVYEVSVDANVDYEGGVGALRYSKTFGAKLLPWLAPLQPANNESYPDSEALQLAVTVMVGCRPNPSAQNMQVQATILRKDEVITILDLDLAPQVSEGVFMGTLPAGILPVVDGKPTLYKAVFNLRSDHIAETNDEFEASFSIVPGQVRPPTPTAEPSLTPTRTVAPPTVTPSPMPAATLAPTLAPTAIPTPVQPEPAAPSSLPLVGAGLAGVALFAGTAFYWGRKPSLAGMTLAGPAGVVQLGGLLSRLAHTIKLRNADGKVLAWVQVDPGGTRHEPKVFLTVKKLAADINEFCLGQLSQDVGSVFEITDGQMLQVGEERYTFSLSPNTQSLLADYPSSAPAGKPIAPKPSPGPVSPTDPIKQPSLLNDEYQDYQ